MIAIFMVIEKNIILKYFFLRIENCIQILEILLKRTFSFLAKTFRNLNWNTWKCFDEVDNINNQTKL